MLVAIKVPNTPLVGYYPYWTYRAYLAHLTYLSHLPYLSYLTYSSYLPYWRPIRLIPPQKKTDTYFILMLYNP